MQQSSDFLSCTYASYSDDNLYDSDSIFSWYHRNSKYNMKNDIRSKPLFYNEKIGLSKDMTQICYDNIAHGITFNKKETISTVKDYDTTDQLITKIIYLTYAVNGQRNFAFQESNQVIILKFIQKSSENGKSGYVFDCIIFNGREFRKYM